MNTRWTLAWSAWLASFAIIEGAAIRAGNGTLTSHVVHWFRTDTKPGRIAWLIVSTGFAVWFTHHIIDHGIRHTLKP